MTGPPITLMKSRRLIELSREPQDHAKRTLVYTTLTVVWGLKSRDENTVASPGLAHPPWVISDGGRRSWACSLSRSDRT